MTSEMSIRFIPEFNSCGLEWLDGKCLFATAFQICHSGKWPDVFKTYPKLQEKPAVGVTKQR